MGANATTFVPAYVAGEVLTAADLSVTNSGIPVFATTTTRDAAFGGTGEKTLAEGQFAYIEATNTTQYYDGAAWQSVGVAPGLVLVKSQTVGSAVSSVSVTDAFSTTYDNYLITYVGGSASGSNELYLRFGSTTANYYWNIMTMAYANTLTAVGGANAAQIQSFRAGATSNNTIINILSPFLTEQTAVTGISIEPGQWNQVNAYLNDTTSYTSFSFTLASGTITGGTIRVYGYANS
jgi:hypothetical protein